MTESNVKSYDVVVVGAGATGLRMVVGKRRIACEFRGCLTNRTVAEVVKTFGIYSTDRNS